MRAQLNYDRSNHIRLFVLFRSFLSFTPLHTKSFIRIPLIPNTTDDDFRTIFTFSPLNIIEHYCEITKFTLLSQESIRISLRMLFRNFWIFPTERKGEGKKITLNQSISNVKWSIQLEQNMEKSEINKIHREKRQELFSEEFSVLCRKSIWTSKNHEEKKSKRYEAQWSVESQWYNGFGGWWLMGSLI